MNNSYYTITGGTPLYGSVRVGGAKNASFKLMIAALLCSGKSRFLNFSHISDVDLVAQLINDLGAQAKGVGERAYLIDPSNLSQHTIAPEHGHAARASTLFIPPMLAKFGKAIVPFPGGDKIGKRPLERHFEGLISLGAKVEAKGNQIHVTADRLVGTTYRFAKNTHTGTETLIMAAVKAKGVTTLENAAEETEIDDLITFFNACGGKIQRTAKRVIKIEGVNKLSGAIHKIMPDQNQVVSFACAALGTKGDVVVENARQQDLAAFLEKLHEAGAGIEIGTYGIRFYYKQPLKAVDVTTQPHPGFKTDWQPLWVALMTQAQGISILHETVSQSRFSYVPALKQMGAEIEFFKPDVENKEATYNFNWSDRKNNEHHAINIAGPTQLNGGEFSVDDLRHGATLIIAGMMAKGKTVIKDPDQHIDRGYEKLDEQLRSIGANIARS